jgi:hypothetical protein
VQTDDLAVDVRGVYRVDNVISEMGEWLGQATTAGISAQAEQSWKRLSFCRRWIGLGVMTCRASGLIESLCRVFSGTLPYSSERFSSTRLHLVSQLLLLHPLHRRQLLLQAAPLVRQSLTE